MITKALTAISCGYLVARLGFRMGYDNARRTTESDHGPTVRFVDSLSSAFGSMAMGAGCFAAPIPSAIVGAAFMARDAYVHREKIKSAANWCAKKLRKRESATVHPILKVV